MFHLVDRRWQNRKRKRGKCVSESVVVSGLIGSGVQCDSHLFAKSIHTHTKCSQLKQEAILSCTQIVGGFTLRTLCSSPIRSETREFNFNLCFDLDKSIQIIRV